jgi:hypothetical protein
LLVTLLLDCGSFLSEPFQLGLYLAYYTALVISQVGQLSILKLNLVFKLDLVGLKLIDSLKVELLLLLQLGDNLVIIVLEQFLMHILLLLELSG